MTAPEMAWMQAMVIKDDMDDYQEKIEFIEYLASFSNPEAVQKIRQERTNSTRMSDDMLQQTLSEITGREAPRFNERENG